MKRKRLILILILTIAGFLRFYNLMFDAPYFFNPDEKNMAVAITQFKLPNNLIDLPRCLISSTIIHHLQSIIYHPSSTIHDPSSATCNLNPHFFAYGQFPLYLAFFSDQFTQFISRLPPSIIYHPRSIIHHPSSITFSDAILWLRFWSAFVSTLTVLLVFLITRRLFENCKFKIENLAALLAAFTPGLIQSAHFGTTESLLTFFFLTLIYLAILYSSNKKILTTYFLLLTSLILGLSLATKVSALIFFPIPFFAILLTKVRWYKKLLFSLFITLCSVFIFILFSPYNILEQNSFRGTLKYESSIALGRIKVFYTRQFENTVPILFQSQKIFPYTLGWPIFLLGSLGFLLINLELLIQLVHYIRHKIQNSKCKILNFKLLFLIFNFSFLIYFLPTAFLYAKWTRFMTPVFPIFAVFTGYFLFQSNEFIKKVISQVQSSKFKVQSENSKLKIKQTFNFKLQLLIFNFALLTYLVLPGLLFFTIYLRPDTRIQASQWIYQNIPADSYVLSETANVVDIPVSLNLDSAKSLPAPKSQSKLSFKINEVVDIPVSLSSTTYHPPSTIISFNFYDLDENSLLFPQLLNHLEKADYIFIPSRRIFINYMRLPDKYPLATHYYELLFSGKLGFEKVAEFSSFPLSSIIHYPSSTIYNPRSMIYDPSSILSDERSEETFTVFDHPVVRIYKKAVFLTKEQYKSLFDLHTGDASEGIPL